MTADITELILGSLITAALFIGIEQMALKNCR